MKKIISVTLFLFAVVCGQKFIGDDCLHQATNSPGKCTLLNNCQASLQALQQNQQLPQTCGFDGTQPIVCCAPSSNRVPGEISRGKCREYAKYVFERKRPPILLIDAEDSEKNECGHKVVELIVGGELSKRKEFPHTAVIGYEFEGQIKWLCGGTIISEEYILTAGHCLVSRDFGDSKYVKMGITELNSSDHVQQFNVIERIAHPEYKPPSHYNDIGLIKLDKRPKFSPFARPACLYTKTAIQARMAIATGFGKMSYAGSTSNSLLKVTLDLIDQVRCNHSYRNQISRKLSNGIIDTTQLCAGSLDPTQEKDTCQGDSGGPLQIYHVGDDIKCMYDIVGVTSFGKACSGSPGVYTRVSQFVKWIEDKVWP